MIPLESHSKITYWNSWWTTSVIVWKATWAYQKKKKKSYMGFTLRKICNGKEIWVGKHNIVKFISTHSNSERSMGRMVTLKLTFTQPDCGWHQHEFKVDTNKNQADKWSRWALFIFSTSFVGFGMYSIKMIWLRNLQILSNKTVAKKSEFVTFINKNLQKSLWKCDIFYQVTWSHCTKWVSEEQRIGHGERPNDMVVYGHETEVVDRFHCLIT